MKTELYWLQGVWPARLAIAPRPRGGDWLEDVVVGWRRAGVGVVVSLLTPDEIDDLELAGEEELCWDAGIEFLAFPINDRGVPASREAFAELAGRLAKRLRAGARITIHCRQGIGRAALVAIGVLILLGLEPGAAIERVSTDRGFPVPETAEQKQWLIDFAKDSVSPVP